MRNLILVFMLFAFLTPVGASACPELTKFEEIEQKWLCENIIEGMIIAASSYQSKYERDWMINYLWKDSDPERTSAETRIFIKKIVNFAYDNNTMPGATREFVIQNCKELGEFSPPPLVRKVLLKK